MEEWQHSNKRRLLSISIEKDEENYCCIALTNPAEVVITSSDGSTHASVEEKFGIGYLRNKPDSY
jgi:hypothetical protein